MIRPADMIAPPRGSGLVLSFFDYTGHAVRDWAAAGWTCWCFDLQHESPARVERVGPSGAIAFVGADLSAGAAAWGAIRERLGRLRPGMVFAFPPCTELATSGARHWARKRAADPEFQARAVAMARGVELFMGDVRGPWMAENPRSALATLWRAPDYTFDPFEFGGYLPEEDRHPRHPKYIAPRDPYTKTTCLWTGGGFVMPEPRPVPPEVLERRTRSGRIVRGSRQFMWLGGASLRTKNIRNETPRGFARAVFEANARPLPVARSDTRRRGRSVARPAVASPGATRDRRLA